MHSRTLRVYAVLICAASYTRSQTTQLRSSGTGKAFPRVLLVFPQTFCQVYDEDTTDGIHGGGALLLFVAQMRQEFDLHSCIGKHQLHGSPGKETCPEIG